MYNIADESVQFSPTQLFIQSRRGCSASNGQGVQLGRYIHKANNNGKQHKAKYSFQFEKDRISYSGSQSLSQNEKDEQPKLFVLPAQLFLLLIIHPYEKEAKMPFFVVIEIGVPRIN